MVDERKSIAAPGRTARVALRAMAGDPVIRGMTALLLAASALQPWLSAEDRYQLIRIATPFLLGAMFWLIVLRRRRSLSEARRFWTDIGVAVGASLLGMLVSWGLKDPTGSPERLILDAIFAIYYVALVRASERSPDHPVPKSPQGAWPVATVFVLGMFLYFVLMTAVDLSLYYQSKQPSRLLGAAVAIYLVLRFAGHALGTTGSWRLTYAAIAATSLLNLAYGWSRMYDELAYGTAFLWYLSFLTFCIAIRAEHPGTPGRIQAAPAPGRHAATGHSALLALVILPIVHFAGYGLFGVLEPDLRTPRELLMCAWLMGFGAIALLERQRFFRRLAHQIDQRSALREQGDSDDDLRVIIERRRTHAALGQSVAKYGRAFDLCPDAIGISTLEEGRFLEVNAAFEAMTGYQREEILGRSAAEVGLWLSLADRERLIGLVRRRGEARNVAIPMRMRDGQQLLVHFWAQLIDIDGEACVIVVARRLDASTVPTIDSGLPAPLDQALAPAVMLDGAGRIRAWNLAANRAFQLDRDTTFDRLTLSEDQPLWVDLRQQLQRRRVWVRSGLRALALDPACEATLVITEPTVVGSRDPASSAGAAQLPR